MKSVAKNNGFSLTEVLMAVGILSVGLMLIATMFPVALYLTSVSVERTMAAIVADEAFAKIQLYKFGNISPLPSGIGDYENTLNTGIIRIDPCEFSYNPAQALANPQYYWSAVYRQIAGSNYQITVFIARKTNAGLTYPDPADFSSSVPAPRPIQIPVSVSAAPDEDKLALSAGQEKFVNPPAAIVDNATGKIYRVIDRRNATVTIDRKWEDATGSADIWLIPPPNTGGRNADIEVYQRIIRF